MRPLKMLAMHSTDNPDHSPALYPASDRFLKEFCGGVFHLYEKYKIKELSETNKRLLNYFLAYLDDSFLEIEFNKMGATITTRKTIIEYVHSDEMQKSRIVKSAKE
jgi:hypothetical protein